MEKKILEKYSNFFNKEAKVAVQAPGRINIIGEHTDYNLGFVLPAAINKYTFFAIGDNGGSESKIISADYDEQMTLGKPTAVTSGGWQKYIESVLIGLTEAGYQIPSFNLVFGGNIPIGAGVSSSAALTCGLIYALSELYDLNITKEALAKLGQGAEVRVGLNCGLMDQYAVIFSKKSHCLRLDCRSLEVSYYPALLDEYSIVLLDTKVTHELVDSEYNKRRNDVETAVKKVHNKYSEVESARDVTYEMLEDVKEEIDIVNYKRLKFVIDENERVVSTCKSLEKNDFEAVGQLMNKSHHGLSEMYEVSCKELDFLAEFAHQNDHVLGSRMMGGGFGGCTINIVKKGNEDIFINAAKEAYQNEMGLQLESYKINLGEGLKRIQ